MLKLCTRDVKNKVFSSEIRNLAVNESRNNNQINHLSIYLLSIINRSAVKHVEPTVGTVGDIRPDACMKRVGFNM